MSRPRIDEAAIRELVDDTAEHAVRGHQGSVHLGTVGGLPVAVKAATGNAVTLPLRRWLLGREHRVYRRLDGITGIPRCYGFVGDSYLVLERIDGETLRHADIVDRDRFFRRFFDIIEAMHDRGVAHGDLMRKDNILVGRDDQPVLIDFGVSEIYKPGFHPLNHAIHRFLWQHDFNAWLKHKYRRKWSQMTPEDARYHRPQLIDRAARSIKRFWVSLFGRGKMSAP